MTGSIFFEKQLKKTGKKIILDFDDAIWLQDVSQGNYYLRWLKKPSKTNDIIHLSDYTLVGNKFLQNYALQFNQNIFILPTTIDTSYYQNTYPIKDKFYIGWTGSQTTVKHLEGIIPVLEKIKSLYPFVHFLFISDKQPEIYSIPFDFEPWDKNNEIETLSKIEIGIMPLPDDDWAKGKCGFKGLQYMALEIPAVLSPVGVNTEIIQDGINGFLADTDEEWVHKLSLLIESESLRKKLGKTGRETVIEKYSFDSQKNNYLKLLDSLI